MKFIVILLLNCFWVLYVALYFIDHPVKNTSTLGKIKQGLLLVVSLFVLYNILFIYILKKKTEESGLFYKIIVFAEKTGHAVVSFQEPVQKEFIISVIIAFLLIVLGFLLSGLPGGLILSLLQKAGLLRGIQGDHVWPAAILLSILWPLCFPFAVLAKQFLLHRGYMGFTGLHIALGLLWIILMIPCIALLSKNNNS